MTNLYVAGPMSGYPGYNYDAFTAAAEQLRDAGFAVENPAENSGEPSWVDYMRVSLRQISRVDGLAVLDGWQMSRGAVLEVQVAHALLLPVLPVGLWLSKACAA